MTPREFSALRDVWYQAIERTNYAAASIQATLYNAHFDTGGIPWTAEDLLGKSSRLERKRASVADKLATQRIAMAASRPGELPEWVTQLEANRKKELVN